MWRKPAYTLVEMCAAISIVGILMAVTVPAVLSARAAARRMQCANNLRQVGGAIHTYLAAGDRLPAGRERTQQRHPRNHSWVSAVLPYLDKSALFENYDWNRTWNDGLNQAVSETDIPVVLCPSTTHNWAGATDYGGNYGSSLSGLKPGFGWNRGWDSGVLVATNIPSFRGAFGRTRRMAVRLAQVDDGASKTFLVLENAGRAASRGGQWANGHNCFAHDVGRVNQNQNNGVFSEHPHGAHALLTDGGVQFMSEDMSQRVLGAMCTRSGSEQITDQWY